jgi:hypothetical protein
MAGRYQGRHVFVKENGEHLHVEVFWQQNGWFWQSYKGRVPKGDVVGPFTRSTEAYEHARGLAAFSGTTSLDLDTVSSQQKLLVRHH